MDFIGPLPKTSRGNDYILNMVDRLSKMAHFLACKKSIDGPGVAALFVDRIWSQHGLPKFVVTDHGTQFLNSFNKALTQMLGTRHAVSSAYHPETDGQTERVNRILNECSGIIPMQGMMTGICSCHSVPLLTTMRAAVPLA